MVARKNENIGEAQIFVIFGVFVGRSGRGLFYCSVLAWKCVCGTTSRGQITVTRRVQKVVESAQEFERQIGKHGEGSGLTHTAASGLTCSVESVCGAERSDRQTWRYHAPVSVTT
jgi:hypothetical protein